MCFGRQKFGDFRIWIPGSCSSRYSPPISYRPKNDNFEYLAIDAPFKRYGFYFSSGYDCYTYQKDAPDYKKAEFVCKAITALNCFILNPCGKSKNGGIF